MQEQGQKAGNALARKRDSKKDMSNGAHMGSLEQLPLEIKLVVLGEVCVGKTSVIKMFTRNRFSDQREQTIQLQCASKEMIVDSDRVTVTIWDTAGQERYKSLAPLYFRGAQIALVVYDISKADTFSAAQEWIHLVRRLCGDILIGIAGNKCDLESERQITPDEVHMITSLDSEVVLLNEISAKTNEGISRTFFTLITQELKKIKERTKLKAQPPRKNSLIDCMEDLVLVTPSSPISSASSSSISEPSSPEALPVFTPMKLDDRVVKLEHRRKLESSLTTAKCSC